MKLNQVAVQLYTLRDFCQTTSDFAVTAKKVREIGFQNVELVGAGVVPDEEIIRILAGEGLRCCSFHESPDLILKSPEKIVERLNQMGCHYVAYPFPAGIDFKSESSVIQFAKDLNHSGEVIHKAGKTLCYHNHASEFERPVSRTVLDILYGETLPQNLQAELDTYWIQFGGFSPVEWCQKMKGRLPLLHIKDYGVNPENHQPIYKEVGLGNLDFKKIIAAAEDSGCQWFIVEQDTCPGNPFDSIQKSFEYVKQQLVS
ncbi:MAG: sugar phosphate isomerase/epimerase [Verrucomicrobiota bacterium]